jgi:hypothetical protein
MYVCMHASFRAAVRIDAADRTSTAVATSACCRERLLTGSFRGDLDRQLLAESGRTTGR